MLTIIFLLIGYTIHLIIDIRDDVPILKTESRTDDSLRFPTVTLEFDYNFTIFCALAYNNSTVTPDCLNYVSQPTFDSSSNKYRGKFVPSLDLKAEGPLHSTGLLSIGLMFLVLDRRYDSSSANMSVIEAVIDYSDDSYDELRRTVKKIDPEFIDSLIVSSVHTLFNRQIYMVSYTQSERHIMKKNSLSVFGIPSPILRVPYITAAL
ncbi:4072_t:CDS:2, partial [Paraglomus occultum]